MTTFLCILMCIVALPVLAFLSVCAESVRDNSAKNERDMEVALLSHKMWLMARSVSDLSHAELEKIKPKEYSYFFTRNYFQTQAMEYINAIERIRNTEEETP